MRYVTLPTPLRRFVDEVGNWLDAVRDERRMLDDIGRAMRALITEDDWLDPACAEPHRDHYQQYLLYVDPADRFSVVSFVWGPNQRTPIHDHTVWGVIGVLRGAELTQRYRIDADGIPIAIGQKTRLLPGAVELVSPSLGDIHEVRNGLGDAISISIHAYGANIGEVRRHVFALEGGAPKTFVSGYANAAA